MSSVLSKEVSDLELSDSEVSDSEVSDSEVSDFTCKRCWMRDCFWFFLLLAQGSENLIWKICPVVGVEIAPTKRKSFSGSEVKNAKAAKPTMEQKHLERYGWIRKVTDWSLAISCDLWCLARFVSENFSDPKVCWVRSTQRWHRPLPHGKVRKWGWTFIAFRFEGPLVALCHPGGVAGLRQVDWWICACRWFAGGLDLDDILPASDVLWL